ncbi:hypothetical protein BK672_02145 [Pseudomonas fluorescens]|uniref:SMODS and SLOG-associating 2TM effector domain-containing protein n=1 Tax=Pseudomonas fluorescens TaxID=294 RepID=A0A423NFV8_PSEFL|nr:hypothetical protein [Pseudomonas fluorescens]RON97117.1 hypothetical protein BK672_02145 [Pseudomonas fluorescens]
MEVKELLVVFEKMYLQENEIKEKITIRVQILFTLILAVITVSSYMLRMLDLERYVLIAASIISSLVVFYAGLAVSAKYAVRAFWGNTFKQMPPAVEVRGYCSALISYNEEVEKAKSTLGAEVEVVDIRSEVDTYLSNVYEECATHNSEINQERSRKVHESFKWLLCSFVPLGIAGILFVGFDMDVSSPRKNFQVVDKYVGDQIGVARRSIDLVTSQVVELRESYMSDSKRTGDKPGRQGENITAPLKTGAPVKPNGPPVRIVLEDDRSQSIEVSDEQRKK